MKTAIALLVSILFTATVKGQTFTDITQSSGLPNSNTWFLEYIDYNNDDFPDVILRDPATSLFSIWKNNGNLTFTDVTVITGFEVGASYDQSFHIADFNKDGWQDILYYDLDMYRLVFLRNENGVFSDQSVNYNLPMDFLPETINTHGFSTAVADFDRDGFLDLAFSKNDAATHKVTIYCLFNSGTAFSSPSELFRNEVSEHKYLLQAIDYDLDGDEDLLTLDSDFSIYWSGQYYNHPIRMFDNSGGNFTEVVIPGLSTGNQDDFAVIWDYNNDGFPDFTCGTPDFVANEPSLAKTFKNNAGSSYTDVTSEIQVNQGGGKYILFNSMIDLDLDGDQDYIGQGYVFLNNVGGSFTFSSSLSNSIGGYNTRINPADLDNDGDFDLIALADPGITTVYENEDTDKNYLKINLLGSTSPLEGQGSYIKVKTGSNSQYRHFYSNQMNVGPFSSSANDIIIGLGAYTSVDSVIVYWPSGEVSELANVPANQSLTINEPEDVPANQNYSLSFNGSSFITIPDSPTLNPSSQLTLEVWIKTDQNHFNAGIAGKWNSTPTTGEQFVLQIASANNLNFHVKNGSVQDMVTVFSINDNNWHHIAGVFSGDSLFVYKDGMLIQAKAYSGVIPSFDQPFEIGRYARGFAGSQNYFIGLIDDVRLWNRALSPAEINSHMYLDLSGSESGLLAYWDFNEGSGSVVVDKTSNHNDGTNYGAVYSSDTPIIHNTSSIHFDGIDDYIEIPHNPSFNFSQFTIEAWFKWKALKQPPFIISKDDGNFEIHLNSDKWVRFQPTAGSQIDGNINSIDTMIWTHIACVFNPINNTGKTYINGIETGYQQQTGLNLPIAPNSSPISIGRRTFNSNPDLFFNGNLDEIRIWDYALTQSEIRENMNQSLTGSETGLVAYWNFNEKTGSTVFDKSPNGNNGTIYGATYSTDSPLLEDSVEQPIWSLKISGSINSYADIENLAGVSDNASNTFDASFDTPEPPANPGNYISVYFPHPEWNNVLGNNFTNDIRSNSDLSDGVSRWFFEVQSNVMNQDVTLNFQNDRIPAGYGRYLTDLQTNQRVDLSIQNTFNYTNSSESPRRFMLVIGDSTSPALSILAPKNGTIWQSGKTKTINWSVSDGTGIDSVKVYYSGDGTAFNLISSTGDQTSFDWTVASHTLNHLNKIKVVAIDSVGNQKAITAPFFTISGDSLATTVSAGWNLLSLPLEPKDSSKSKIIGDDFSSGPYYLWEYSGQNGYQEPQFLHLGSGFWLGALSTRTVDVSGSVFEADSIIQQLTPGYNLIGNQFVKELSKSNLFILANGIEYSFDSAVENNMIGSVLYGFDGTTYQESDTLKLFKGYWILALTDQLSLVQKVRGRSVPLAKRLAKTSEIHETDWMVDIAISSTGKTHQPVTFGTNHGATENFDNVFDNPLPPKSPAVDYVDSWFELSGSYPEIIGNRFKRDITDNLSLSWTLNVETNQSGSYTLSWNPEPALSDPYLVSLSLKNMNNDEIIDMLAETEYGTEITGSVTFSIIGVSNSATVPVELVSFTGENSGTTTILSWQTKSEINNSGWEVERKSANSRWEKLGFVSGKGTTSESNTYSYSTMAISRSSIYRLKQIDMDGKYSYSKSIELGGMKIAEFKLFQNFPNPFNPTTVISFTLPKAEKVELKVMDMLGRVVKTLINNELRNEGLHQITFDASTLSNGVYFYQVTAGRFKESKKMLLMK